MNRILLATLALSLTGCQVADLFAGGKANPPSAKPSVSDRSLARFGGLSFTKLSNDGAGYLGGSPGMMPNMAGGLPMSAPAVATDMGSAKGEVAVPQPVGTPMPMPSLPYYGGYSSGPFGQMKLESVTEAKAPGAQGSLKQVIEQVVKPILKDWADDAALVGSAGVTQPSTPSPYWMLNYASNSNLEAMLFFITPQEMRVLFLRWKPMTIDMDEVKVEGADAIDLVTGAVRDLSVKSLEEVRGVNFFYSEFSGGYLGPMPMPMPVGGGMGMPQPANVNGVPVAPPVPLASPSATPAPAPQPSLVPVYKNEPITELPSGGSWNISLAPIGAHLVWNLYYSAPMSPGGMPSRYPPQEGDSYTWTNSYVSAMVDARTGELIRLSRPSKSTTTWVRQ